ncbi:unnamed protein product [Protopolystoma xenopodis]|uniref:Uncharacterized protein n=1 Tax=Protopolystoma xenopodis TaxID=117903 RepID=A0A3S5ALV9_9PLAT|nr:unnamed protein product [Protopolystoma xenopodis]
MYQVHSLTLGGVITSKAEDLEQGASNQFALTTRLNCENEEPRSQEASKKGSSLEVPGLGQRLLVRKRGIIGSVCSTGLVSSADSVNVCPSRFLLAPLDQKVHRNSFCRPCLSMHARLIRAMCTDGHSDHSHYGIVVFRKSAFHPRAIKPVLPLRVQMGSAF